MGNRSSAPFAGMCRLLFAPIACILLTPCANAFSVDNHNDITRKGLADATITLSGTSFGFSPTAVDEIAAANEAIDACGFHDENTCAGFRPGTARSHFDDNTIKEGSDLIHDRLVRVIDMVSKAQLAAIGHDYSELRAMLKASREVFGGTLHTIQDFYAHSTWVERFGTAYNIPWGASFSPGTKSAHEYIKSKSLLDGAISPGSIDTCQYGAAYGGTGAAPVASEFFKFESQSVSSGNCVHGPSSALTCLGVIPVLLFETKDALACAEGLYVDQPLTFLTGTGITGINKDRRRRGKIFMTAHEAAMRATRMVAIDLLATVSVLGNTDKRLVCAFLDAALFDSATGRCIAGEPIYVYRFRENILVAPVPVATTVVDTDTIADVTTLTVRPGDITNPRSYTLRPYNSAIAPPAMCRVGDHWIPKFIRQSQNPAPTTSPCEASQYTDPNSSSLRFITTPASGTRTVGQTVTRSFELDTAGNLRVTDNTVDSLVAEQCSTRDPRPLVYTSPTKYTGSETVNTSLDIKINLNHGSGTYHRTSRRQFDYRYVDIRNESLLLWQAGSSDEATGPGNWNSLFTWLPDGPLPPLLSTAPAPGPYVPKPAMLELSETLPAGSVQPAQCTGP